MNDDYIVLYNSESWINRINRKSLTIELLEAAIVFYLIYIPIFATLSKFMGNEIIIRGMLMLPVNLLVTYIKCKAKSGKVFLTYNISIISLVYLVYPTLPEKILYSIVLLAVGVIKLVKLHSQKVNFWTFSFFFFNGGFFSILFLVMSKLNFEMGKTLITLAAVHNLISLLIYFHIVGRDNIFAWEEQQGSRLMNGMKKTSGFVIGMLTMTLVMLNVLLWKLGIFSAVDGIKISFDFNRNPVQVNESTTEEIEDGFINAAEKLQAVGGETRPLIKIIATIIEVALMVAAAVVIMYLIFNLIISIKSFLLRIMGERHVDEKHESLMEEFDLGVKLSKKISGIKRVIDDIMDLSNDKRIRNLYKKVVKKYKVKGVVPERYDTACDISYKIENVSGKNYAELTQLYHKARYSAEQCSGEDLERAKKYI